MARVSGRPGKQGGMRAVARRKGRVGAISGKVRTMETSSDVKSDGKHG